MCHDGRTVTYGGGYSGGGDNDTLSAADPTPPLPRSFDTTSSSLLSCWVHLERNTGELRIHGQRPQRPQRQFASHQSSHISKRIYRNPERWPTVSHEDVPAEIPVEEKYSWVEGRSQLVTHPGHASISCERE